LPIARLLKFVALGLAAPKARLYWRCNR